MEYVKIQVDTKVMKEIERLAKARGLELQDAIDKFMALGAGRLKSLREYNKKKAEELGKEPPKPRKRAKPAEEAALKPKKKPAKKKAAEEAAPTEGRVKRPTPLKPRKKKVKAEEAEADPMAPILEEA